MLKKKIIKTSKGDISRGNKIFWFSVYQEYLECRNAPEMCKDLNIDIRMLKNIFKEYGYSFLNKSEVRKGKIKKEYIENNKGIKYYLKDINFWDNIYEDYYINKNFSEDRLSQHLGITRKQLRRVFFKYYNYPSKSKEQVKNTIVQSNIHYYGEERPALNKAVKRKISLSHLENRVDGVRDKIKSSGYELLDDYKGTRVFDTGGPLSIDFYEYNFKHIECGTIFKDKLDRTPRCPICFNTESQLENNMRRFIESLGFNTNKYKVNYKDTFFEIDIFIPGLNIGFEYNGSIWHSSRYNKKYSYHKDKTELALSKGIKLYHIWEHDNEEIIKSKIKQILGKTENRIYARKCEVREVRYKEQLIFLEDNHLFKHITGSICLGLYFNDELVSYISFKSNKGEMELNRFCNKINTSVVGGFSKLLKHAIPKIKELGYSKIITFAYRDWTPDYKNSVYLRNGFNFVRYGNPSLSYYKHSNRELINRQKFMKNKLRKLFPDVYNENLTEKEILAKKGIYALYNSGIIKFELNIT